MSYRWNARDWTNWKQGAVAKYNRWDKSKHKTGYIVCSCGQWKYKHSLHVCCDKCGAVWEDWHDETFNKQGDSQGAKVTGEKAIEGSDLDKLLSGLSQVLGKDVKQLLAAPPQQACGQTSRQVRGSVLRGV